MVLTSVIPESAAKAVSIARSRRMPVWQAEEHVLGFNHGELGAALVRSWGLPDVITEAIAYHHQPARTSTPLATIVYLADAAAHVVGAVGGGGACPPAEWDISAAEALGLDAEQIDDFLRTLDCVEESEL
jgi:HD-like signal output (HDOD) protein